MKVNQFIIFNLISLLLLSSVVDVGAKQQADDTITIVSANNSSPFTFSLPDGTATGFYIEFWQLWAKTNNIPINVVVTSFEESVKFAKTKNVIHSGLFINDNRKQWADFTSEIHSVKSGIVYNKKFSKTTKLGDTSGLKVAVLINSFQEAFLRDNHPSLELVLYNDLDKMVTKLLNNEIDAIVAEIPTLYSQIARLGLNGVFTFADEVLLDNLVHGVIAKNQPVLLETINRGLENIPLKKLIELEKKWLPLLKPYYKQLASFDALTISEKIWLKNQSTFSLGVDTAWYPFDYTNAEGKHIGVASDYIDYVSKIINIDIVHDKRNTWREAFEKLKIGEIDMMSAAIATEERSKLMNFTEPYFVVPTVIVTRKSTSYIQTMAHIGDKTLGLIEGYVLIGLIEQDHPDMNILAVKSVADGLAKLQSGEIDAFINSIAVINDELDKAHINDLMISGFSPYQYEISMAVRKGLEPLVPILNKIFASMTDKQKASIANAWLAVEVKTGTELKVILLWSLPILSLLMLIIFIIVRVNRRLKSEITIRKLSEEKRHALERQLNQSQKIEALGKLTGGIAHDFNNLLSIILGYSDLLRTGLTEQPEFAKYANYIHHAGERGSKLTNKLLSFSSKKPTKAGKLDINSILQHQFDIIQRALTVRIELIFELTDNVWPIYVDESDLEDAIFNMSINAMHAMENSGIKDKLTIRTYNQTLSEIDVMNLEISSGDYVQLSITDNGSGMDEKTKEKIFDPFYSTKGVKGTGLGLSQVFGFVKRSGGDIRVYSEVGHGSQFAMYFPRYLTQSDENKTIDNTSHSSDLKGHETILIVDDEESLRTVTSILLKKQGYKVHCANNGQHALEILTVESVDLMLTDVIMPEMDGYQLTAAVQEKYPNVKIQMASGFTDDRHKDLVNRHLHQNMLHKPYDSQALLRKIRQLLDN